MKGKLLKIDKEKLPVYQIMVDDMDETGISLISLVDEPAIQMKGMAFSENNGFTMEFKSVEGDKQIIVGPALIPDMKIYREDERFGQYYVVFTKETIAKMVEKFNRSGSNRRINIDHSNQMVDGFILEDWIVEHETFDKAKKYGFDVPVGTYMIMVKIENTEFWNQEVKGLGKFGFSIEGMLGQQLISMSKIAEITIDDLDENELLEIVEDVEKWHNEQMFKKWKISNIDSSNVRRMMYEDETKTLIIEFQDKSTYTYFNIDFDTFKKVWEGRASCKTDDDSDPQRWWYGKNPSVGAAVYEYLVVEGVVYQRGGKI